MREFAETLNGYVMTLYVTASNASPYFVAIPTTPVNQHHNTAPGMSAL